MATKIEITYSTDAVLGHDTQAIAQIDVEKSLDKYDEQLMDALNEAFPGAEIEIGRSDTDDSEIKVYCDDHDEDDIKETVQDIDAKVYDNGTFWVNN